jgi:hypothetical protein
MGCCAGYGSFFPRDVKTKASVKAASPITGTGGVAYKSCNKMQSHVTLEDYTDGFESVTEPSLDYLTISATDINEPEVIGRQIASISSDYSRDKRATNRYDIGLEILKAKIQLGADPKVLHSHGDRSCLMFAVLANDIRFVKQLVEFGVDVNQRNSQGETALGFAIELKRHHIATYLCSKGAIRSVD